MKLGRVVLSVFLMLSFFLAVAQDDNHKVNIGVPNVALVSVKSGNYSKVLFQPENPNQSGNFLSTTGSDTDLWINYSSVAGKQKRAVMVALEDGSLPPGMDLFIAAKKSVSGKGEIGMPVGKVKLSNKPSVLIQNIGTAYTESGAQKGHQLNYELRLNESQDQIAQLDYEALNDLVITYTITEM